MHSPTLITVPLYCLTALLIAAAQSPDQIVLTLLPHCCLTAACCFTAAAQLPDQEQERDRRGDQRTGSQQEGHSGIHREAGGCRRGGVQAQV
jgi:hypothetical protein